MTFHQYMKMLSDEDMAEVIVNIAEVCVDEGKVPEYGNALRMLNGELPLPNYARKCFFLNAVDCVVWTLAVINIVEIFAHIPLTEWSIWGVLGCSAFAAVAHTTYKTMKGDI